MDANEKLLRIEKLCMDAARRGELRSYDDACACSGLSLGVDADFHAMIHFLEIISTQDYKQGLGMITAVVVNKIKETGELTEPGPGFYRLARKLHHSQAPPRDDAAEYLFWEAELKRVWEIWKDR